MTYTVSSGTLNPTQLQLQLIITIVIIFNSVIFCVTPAVRLCYHMTVLRTCIKPLPSCTQSFIWILTTWRYLYSTLLCPVFCCSRCPPLIPLCLQATVAPVSCRLWPVASSWMTHVVALWPSSVFCASTSCVLHDSSVRLQVGLCLVLLVFSKCWLIIYRVDFICYRRIVRSNNNWIILYYW